MLQQLKEILHSEERLLEVAAALNHTSDHLEQLVTDHSLSRPIVIPPPVPAPAPLPDPVAGAIFEE